MLIFILILFGAIYSFCKKINFCFRKDLSLFKLLKIIYLYKIDFFEMLVLIGYSLFCIEYFFNLFYLLGFTHFFLEIEIKNDNIYTFGKGNSILKSFGNYFRKEGSSFDDLGKFSAKEKYSNLDNSDSTNNNIKNSRVFSGFESTNNNTSSITIDSQTHLDKNFNETLTNDMKNFSSAIKKNSQLLDVLSKIMPYDFSNLDQNYVEDHLYYLPADLVKEKFGFLKNDAYCKSINRVYDHPWLLFYDVKNDQVFKSAFTSYSNIPLCRTHGIGCGDALICYMPIMEKYTLNGDFNENYTQYMTNPILVDSIEEKQILVQLLNEKTLLKNYEKSQYVKYENYMYNLKDNNYLYKTDANVWCKKSEELRCKMNQYFFNQIDKK